MRKRPAAVTTVTTLRDLKPDAHNANKGTQRGRAMLETSVRRYGMGRSLLADRYGRIIAGNKTLEAATNAGLEDTIVVRTDGSKVVVVQRTDLDLDKDIKAKELAIADNQANAVGLSFDGAALQELEQQGVDMRQFFRSAEWEKLVASEDDLKDADGIPEMALQPFEEYNYLMVVCKNSQDWQGLVDRLGVRREAATLGATRKVGLGRVIEGGKLLEALNACASSSRAGAAPTSSKKARSASSRARPSVSASRKLTPTAGSPEI